MVKGIESFREKFKDYADCYTIIGGTACDILMGEADLNFRVTKDVDIILILEERGESFAKVFWEYIKEGGYKCGWRNSEETHFYRFTDPKSGYPIMIELFSRNRGYMLEKDEEIIPIHIDDDISSLSAILLNDDFFEFMLTGRKTAGGISVLDAEHLIPFKMYAWLDLRKKKAAGEHVNDRDYKKHKNDIFRLLRIAKDDAHIETVGLVKESIEEFFTEIIKEPVQTEQLGAPVSFGAAIELLKQIYR